MGENAQNNYTQLIELGSTLMTRRVSLGMNRSFVARSIAVSPSYIWLVENATPRNNTNRPSVPSEVKLSRWVDLLKFSDPDKARIFGLAGYHKTEVISPLVATDLEAYIHELRGFVETPSLTEQSQREIIGQLRLYTSFLRYQRGL